MLKLTFLLFAVFLQLAHSSCPKGLEPVRDGQCRGFRVELLLFQNEAVDNAIEECNNIQAQPVIIHNEEEQEYWASQHKVGADILLGIVCNTKSRKWEWADGSAIDYNPLFRNLNSTEMSQSCSSGCAWSIVDEKGNWMEHCGSATAHGTYDIYCIAPLHPIELSDDNCRSLDDYTKDEACYEIGLTAGNWQNAQDICRQLGANVASVHSQQENNFIRRLAVSGGQVGGVFLGATPSAKANEFGWIDGTAWDYDHFLPGFPVNGLGDCLVMNTDDTSGQWVNVDCASKLPFACMRRVHYASPECVSGPWKEGETIYSPGYPIEASIPCEFILNVPSGKKVELQVVSLEANSCCDHLILYENYFGSTVIANLTGEVADKVFTTSSSNYMRVSWQPNGGVNVRGMMITYRAV